MGYFLGIELGSTRIKAVLMNEQYKTVSGGDYVWESKLENGIWTYELSEALEGVRRALSGVAHRDEVVCMGVSAMMHGYLAFDKDWNLLVPFRTWQNTCTGEAAAKLTGLFGFNIPQRWSIAHLYQAVLNKEPHVGNIAHITTLAGYIHYRLTGVNAVGIGEASGMFPIDTKTLSYDAEMLDKFRSLEEIREMPWDVTDILPKVLPAGEAAGALTKEGAALLDGLLKEGVLFAPAEGDAGTGMTATNAVAPRTGNVSAGTSVFSMVVLEKPLKHVYEELDIVTTPTGREVAMVHCNNCTKDMNAWVGMFKEMLALFGTKVSANELYTGLYQKSLEGDVDCGGILTYNYMSGEGVTHMDAGRPMVVRKPDKPFTLANFLRSQLYATMSTLKIGMDLLAQEQVAIDSLTGHGGLFKTPVVGQKFMAAACNAPVTCMETAGEGGPYGMALLAAYRYEHEEGESLERYLADRVFVNSTSTTELPDTEDVAGFNRYIEQYKKGLEAERMAVQVIE